MSHPIDNREGSQSGFWLQRWRDGDIGWHHQETNPHLLAHWHSLNAKTNSRVFVPLCGKSRDMVWLAQQGHSIVGIEISEIAVEEFFSEQGMIPERTSSGPFQRFRSEEYELLCGDIFSLERDHIPQICGDIFSLERDHIPQMDAVYDRASLVALDVTHRQAYAVLLADLLPTGCKVLLVAMDYPQDEMQGPPYSVPEDEVHILFGADFQITHLHELDLLQDTERYSDRGISRLSEHIYMLQRN